jgi:sugar O-acyltransferase (sialic acid O-acetyltransferase NeuD family)
MSNNNVPEMIWIHAEKNSPSDEELFVIDLKFIQGDKVLITQPIIEVEGAKAIFEIEAPISGYVYFFVEVNEKVTVGDSLAIISPNQLESLPIRKQMSEATQPSNSNQSTKLTGKALDFVNKTKISLDKIEKLHNLTLIKEKNIKRFFTSGLIEERIPHKNPEKILILGGGDAAEMAYDLLAPDIKVQISGLADPKFNILEAKGIPTLSDFNMAKIENLIATKEICSLLVALSDISQRKIFLNLARKYDIQLVSVVSPKSYISESAEFGSGLYLGDFSRLGPEVFLGDNILLSSYVNIEHHCVIGDNTTFGPGVFLSGRVTIGKDCLFGAMVSVEPKVNIGENCIVASGSVITRDIPANSIVKNEDNIRIRPRNR